MTTRSPSPSSRPRHVSVLAWLRLIRVFQKVEQTTARGLRCSDLSLAHFDVLMHVGGAEGITQQKLADSLLVTKGNVCQLLGRMEDADLLCRVPDGRANRLYLTEHGRRVYESTGPAHEGRVATCFSALTEEEQRLLLRLLSRLDRSLEFSGRPGHIGMPAAG